MEHHPERPSSLESISRTLTSSYATLSHRELPAEQLSLEDSHIRSAGNPDLRLTPAGTDALMRTINVPPRALRDAKPDEKPHIAGVYWNSRKNNLGNTNLRIIVDHDQIVGVTPARFAWTSPATVGNAIVAGTNGIPDVHVEVETTSDLCEVRLTSPARSTEPREGDVVEGGVRIAHAIDGHAPTTVDLYLRRLICRNGMLSHVSLGREVATTPQRHEHDLRVRRDSADVGRRIQTLVALGWQRVQHHLDALPHLAEHTFDPDLLPNIAHRLFWSRGLQQAVRNALFEDEAGVPDPLTAYDMINAVSRVATHGSSTLRNPLTERQRLDVMRTALRLNLWTPEVDKCGTCGRLLEMVN